MTNSKKPTRPGQLFYKDMFKLEPNTELILHYTMATGEKKKAYHQFIKVGVKTYSHDRRHRWSMYYRDQEGSECIYEFRGFGLVPRSDGTWGKSYLTLRYPKQLVND